ncbi:MAG: outer membrane protein OmpK, partial [Plesiomonas sp.]
TTGIQYRYADKKLGSAAYQDGLIYSVKYNF